MDHAEPISIEQARAECRVAEKAFDTSANDGAATDALMREFGGRAGFDAFTAEFRQHVPREDWPTFQAMIDDPSARPHAARAMRDAIAAAKARASGKLC